MNFRIELKRPLGELGEQHWTYILLEDKLVLDRYEETVRKSRRHRKAEVVKHYNRLPGGWSERSTMHKNEVPWSTGLEGELVARFLQTFVLELPNGYIMSTSNLDVLKLAVERLGVQR